MNNTDHTTATVEPAIRLESVTKQYVGAETVTALADVDLPVYGGEFLAIVGPSGSGKSTMLNLLGLLDGPTEGVVRLGGRDVTDLSETELTDARREYIGFVFQDFHLLPTLTAVENVTLPTAFTDGQYADRAVDLLGRVGLGDRLDHTPDELSGGQKQRVAIARALINRPEILLADEPTGNLDRETGVTILEEVRRICERGVAVVAVTHDELVTEYADRTVRLVDGRLGEGDDGFAT
ncbi:ATP-binding cassette domain-containing protein [Halovenus sp. WSH3]|uniref:ATP-binding cassette domain-containing protein n=1 Tax=Halovenus carboxidivorans TaxID=2692199 RepID=A0A6B0TD02_9EURY|nr:ABC transporter ATP-binding protein [Halovenus carboxidivorans]MXR52790.1 ATP-binding cassette domain-containing protein [Halovenus carboxidivorans]